jgi:hypothetical protein
MQDFIQEDFSGQRGQREHDVVTAAGTAARNGCLPTPSRQARATAKQQVQIRPEARPLTRRRHGTVVMVVPVCRGNAFMGRTDQASPGEGPPSRRPAAWLQNHDHQNGDHAIAECPETALAYAG